MSARIIRSV